MSQTLTPQKATSLGVLLVALWLIMMGIWHSFDLVFFTFRELPGTIMLTGVTIFLTVLWKTLPLIIGLILFRQHRSLVRWFYGYAVLEEERNSWHDTTLLATLIAGLLGLFLTARALEALCGEYQIILWILEIDNPNLSALYGSAIEYSTWSCLWILYPLILGLAFVAGANRIGTLIGRAIDKSLASPSEEPTEKEEDDSL